MATNNAIGMAICENLSEQELERKYTVIHRALTAALLANLHYRLKTIRFFGELDDLSQIYRNEKHVKSK